MKREVKTAAGTTVLATVFTYQRKAQFTGKLEYHTGIESRKVKGAYNPIENGLAMLGIYHTNAKFVEELKIDAKSQEFFDTFKGACVDNNDAVADQCMAEAKAAGLYDDICFGDIEGFDFEDYLEYFDIEDE